MRPFLFSILMRSNMNIRPLQCGALLTSANLTTLSIYDRFNDSTSFLSYSMVGNM